MLERCSLKLPKVAQKLLKSCSERQNVQNVEQQNVAPNSKNCSKVTEHNRDRPNPDIPEIVEFSKGEPLNKKFHKFQEEGLMETKFPVRDVRKFLYMAENSEKLLLHSSLEISWKFKPEFCIKWKASFVFISREQRRATAVPRLSVLCIMQASH